MFKAAITVVDLLLESQPRPSRNGRIVRVKTPNGVIQCDWNGYYDLREVGGGVLHSIGYPDNAGGWTHGSLHTGDELLDEVPSVDDWKKSRGRS